MLQVGVPDFDLHFAASLVNLQTTADYSEVIAHAFIDHDVSARLTLKNEPATGKHDPIQIKEVSLGFEVGAHRPRAHFFLDSLYAMLGLAPGVRVAIPEVGFDVGLRFDVPLPEISTLLQRRQLYFGLIVIERATGLEFEIPEDIPGDDIDSISFAYHAIVEREFRWVCNDVTLMMPATEESLTWIGGLPPAVPGGSAYRVMFGPAPKTRTIFGQTAALGDETLFLDDAVIQNREEVVAELSAKDGHIVPVRFRPLSRMGRYVLTRAPRLPDEPWDERIIGCINLEDTLNERLVARYHELATSSLAGLTPETAEAVTARPTLDEDAHLIGD